MTIFEIILELEIISNILLWVVVIYLIKDHKKADDRFIDLMSDLRGLINSRKGGCCDDSDSNKE